MFAVVESGGKQYRVRRGDRIQVDRLSAEAGDKLVLDRVLLVTSTKGTLVGEPIVDGVAVDATVVRQERGEKIIVLRYKPKKRYRKKTGARRDLTLISIDAIRGSDQLDDDAEVAEAARAASAEAATALEGVRAARAQEKEARAAARAKAARAPKPRTRPAAKPKARAAEPVAAAAEPVVAAEPAVAPEEHAEAAEVEETIDAPEAPAESEPGADAAPAGEGE
ncbi:MAG: 50S ribosomal protein L21 [Candidatus Dormibacteria bacterium]